MGSKRQEKLRRSRRREAAKRDAGGRPTGPSREAYSLPAERNALIAVPRVALAFAGCVILALFVWAYWPTLRELVRDWDSEPDYSHGYFVLPLAVYFLWARRDCFPGVSRGHLLWPGIVLLCFSVALRYAAGLYYLQPIDNWSILLWVAGVVWLIGGWNWIRWCLPSILFLLFMFPLPYRMETMLSRPLQQVAAMISAWTLQCFGLSAFAQGNTIQLGNHRLEVEQACAGLTIFVGIAALAFAYMVLVKRGWWEKTLLVIAILPIALIANSARIVLTGLLQEFASESAAQKFSHDLAGWLMLPFAAILFALTLWYVDRLFPTVCRMDVHSLVQDQAGVGAEQSA